MRSDIDTLRPMSLVTGWLLSVQGILLCLLTAVLGQGLGAWLGGCAWIGISVPVDRQVWALVNQPNLAFAASGAATGYWLASVLLPWVTAMVLLLCFPRPSTVNAELLCSHTAWAMAVVGVAFVPLLDATDGHLARWLHFAGLPAELRWAATAFAVPPALLSALRLLALSRVARPHAGRASRIAVLVFHLALPSLAWIGVAAAVAGRVPMFATFSALLVILTVLVTVCFRYPRPPVHQPRQLGGADPLRAGVIVCLLAVLVWLTGHPVGGGGRSALLWAPPSASNNQREWVVPAPLLAARPSSAHPASAE